MPQTLRLPRPRCGLAMTRNWNVFIWKTDVFCFMRSFFARYCSASSFKRSFRKSFRFQSFRSGNCSVFPQNPPDLSLRGGRSFSARRGNLKRRDLPFRNELWLRGTKQNLEIRKADAKRCSKSPVFCDRDYFLLHAPVLRSGIPYL